MIHLMNQIFLITLNRLAWAGRMVHMNNDRTLKKIFNTKPGVRNVGKQKL
jgi:hypothetical protein